MEWIVVGPMAVMATRQIRDFAMTWINGFVKSSVEIDISNRTRNITLKNPRTYLNCGRCSVPPKQELSPGSSDTCHFLGSYQSLNMAGVLVYEAESFTLAIHFSNPMDNKFPMELGLELSPGKAHQGRLEDTYTRMAHGTYSSSCPDIKVDHGIMGEYYGTAQLSHGPVKVMAAMSSDFNSCLKVVLEEQGGLGEEAGTQNPCRDPTRLSENLWDLQGDIVDSPGTAWMA